MSDDRTPKQDYSRPSERPATIMIMLWVVAAIMLLLVGLWISG